MDARSTRQGTGKSRSARHAQAAAGQRAGQKRARPGPTASWMRLKAFWCTIAAAVSPSDMALWRATIMPGQRLPPRFASNTPNNFQVRWRSQKPISFFAARTHAPCGPSARVTEPNTIKEGCPCGQCYLVCSTARYSPPPVMPPLDPNCSAATCTQRPKQHGGW